LVWSGASILSEQDLVMGVDLGTGGARVVIAAANGDVVAIANEDFTRGAVDQPGAWWVTSSNAIRGALEIATSRGCRSSAIRAVSVDGTSGTVVGVDEAGQPTTPALMYHDSRANEEADELTAVAIGQGAAAAQVSPSFGIAKIRWIERHRPADFAATHLFVHQADFISGRLTGRVGATDYSNALKTGFDLAAGAWANWLGEFPDLRAKLPRVIAPGDPVGVVSPSIAGSFGLSSGVPVLAGCTDGTAAFLASGASKTGDDNTTLGTTLVFKRVADRQIQDPDGLLYCHKLPGGSWLPGAASNVGGGWVRRDYPGADLRALDEAAGDFLPSAHLAYPLCVEGERFPFAAAGASAFCEPAPTTPEMHFAAHMQGTAFVERLAYEVLDRATGGRAEGDVYATGGGSQSDLWMQLRADVTGRSYHRPECHESAFGSAVLAASAIHGDVWAASRKMVRIQKTFHPEPDRHRRFSEYYLRFRRLLLERGYLQG